MKERKIIQSSKSWRDLDRTIKKLIKNKQTTLAGSIFEHLTKLYFEVSPEYKTKLSKVYLLNEVPNALKKKLKLPNTDEGIDLIAETFDKEWILYRQNKLKGFKKKPIDIPAGPHNTYKDEFKGMSDWLGNKK